MLDRRKLIRSRHGTDAAKVGFVELFFDLVFVFAVTQVSHFFLANLNIAGALQALILLLAVWWVWVFTSWVTNWLDPETTPVRIMLFLLMLAGLIVSASIPMAFAERGAWFAGAYVAMQVGRSLFTLFVLRGIDRANYRNFQRITAWLSASAAAWLAGGLSDGDSRTAYWTLAIAIELVSPAFGFWAPGIGRSQTTDWNIAGEHLAERCGLFIIIALGESVLITGSTFAGLTWTPEVLMAFVVSLTGSATMWWIYFHVGAKRATKAIEETDNPGRFGRLAYTYIHVVIVGGIMVSAAADEILLGEPGDRTGLAETLLLVGGPMLFLAGCTLFKWSTTNIVPRSHLIGFALFGIWLALSFGLPCLVVGFGALVTLIAVAILEYRWAARPDVAE
jgi:low temperature requirement protein LtrA